eukprot:COSAG01_NODE_4732_length_4777_cov_1.971624_3_plen_76_part_00
MSALCLRLALTLWRRWLPLGPGSTSLGMRINAVSFFKGAIKTVRISPWALSPAELLPPPPPPPPRPAGSSPLARY